MAMRVAVQMDPIERIRVAGDSTFALLLEAQKRRHELSYYTPDRMALVDGKLYATVRPLAVRDKAGDHFTLGKAKRVSLSSFDVVLMRQDPPFDLAYEISNHAHAGAACRHNLVYWRYREYAGVGPGAHGRIGADGARRATATERNPERWLAAVEARGHGFTTDEALSGGEQADELLLMGLRLREGINTARYQALSGRTFDAERVSALAAEGLIESRAGMLRVTAAGFPLLDAIVADLAA